MVLHKGGSRHVYTGRRACKMHVWARLLAGERGWESGARVKNGGSYAGGVGGDAYIAGGQLRREHSSNEKVVLWVARAQRCRESAGNDADDAGRVSRMSNSIAERNPLRFEGLRYHCTTHGCSRARLRSYLGCVLVVKLISEAQTAHAFKACVRDQMFVR